MAATALLFAPNPIPRATKLHSPHFAPARVLIPQSCPSRPLLRLRLRRLHAAATGEEVVADFAITAGQVVAEEEVNRRKLYVTNMPWTLTAEEIEKLFGECGTVTNVDVIKQRNGRSRGFAFVTMGTDEEAQAAVEKFNSYELMGRTIRVEFSKSFNKPSRSPAPALPDTATIVDVNKLYVSNLAWKARSTHLREIFAKFKPVSARVVFETSAGKSAGYGFVGFATQEDAAAALAELDGKEILGRPIRLRLSQRVDNETGGAKSNGNVEGVSEEAKNAEGQTDTS